MHKEARSGTHTAVEQATATPLGHAVANATGNSSQSC